MNETSRKITDSVAAELRAHRARLKLTQGELAAMLGVDPATVSKWENGGVPLTLEGLHKYAEAFGTSVGALVTTAGF